MGLDLVELAMEVEDAFGISIPNEDAEKIITVGQLYHFVVANLPAQETKRCLSAAAFYRFRLALTDQFGADRKAVRPSTLLASLVPERERRREWDLLGRRVDWRLPTLVRPAWMSVSLGGILLGWAAATIAVWDRTFGFSASAFPLVIAAVFCGAVPIALSVLRLTTPFATRFSRECLTVRGTVQAALVLNFRKVSLQESGWNRREVWTNLRAIIVKQLGVRPEQVVESAEFVKDFGAD